MESTVRLGNAYTGFATGTLDDLTWPTRGTLLRSKLALYSPIFLSEADFVRGFTQLSINRKLAGRRLVWSGGMRVGLADTYGDTAQIPLSERFFAGGDNSIRGFKRDSIVAVGFPTDELAAAGITAEDSLGGHALFILNQELVAPLLDPLAVVAFYDAGNVYWQFEDFDATDLRHAAGLGLRVKTPAGPLRLEYAWKLDRNPDESRGRLHFSIGIPF